MAQDDNSRKNLYRSLVNSKDKDARETFSKFGFPEFEKRLLGDKDFANEIAAFQIEQGDVKDDYAFHDKYLVVPKSVPHQAVPKPVEEKPTTIQLPVPEPVRDPTKDAISMVSTGVPVVSEPPVKEPGFVEKYIKKPLSDFASGFNRAVLKTPSSLVKTASELGTGVGNLMGMDLKVEDDKAYQVADAYEKWIDDSEFGKQFIGDKEVNSLAGDVGSGGGQIVSMLGGGGQAKTVGGLIKAALGLKAGEKLASNPKVVQAVAGKFLNPQTAIAFGQVFNSEYEGMKQVGESDKTAFNQALINGLAMAPLENIPLANLASRMEKSIGAPIAKRVLNGLLQGAEEGTQEGFQQVLSNLSNNQLVELESNVKEWGDGVERSSDAGAIVGLILGAIAGVKGGRTRKPPTELGGVTMEPVSDDAPPLEPETPPEVQRQTDAEIEAGQQRTGFVPPSPLEGYSQEAKNLIQSASQGKMVSLEPVKELMQQVYNDYQIYTEQKNSTARNLTIPQIEAGQAEMESVLDVLGDYISKRDGGTFLEEFVARFRQPDTGIPASIENQLVTDENTRNDGVVSTDEGNTPTNETGDGQQIVAPLQENSDVAESEETNETPSQPEPEPQPPTGVEPTGVEPIENEPVAPTRGDDEVVPGSGTPEVDDSGVQPDAPRTEVVASPEGTGGDEVEQGPPPMKFRLRPFSERSIKGLNTSVNKGVYSDNRAALGFLNEYPDHFAGLEIPKSGATKITGVSGDKAKIERVNTHSIELSFINPSTGGKTNQVLHFTNEKDRDFAVDLIYDLVDRAKKSKEDFYEEDGSLQTQEPIVAEKSGTANKKKSTSRTESKFSPAQREQMRKADVYTAHGIVRKALLNGLILEPTSLAKETVGLRKGRVPGDITRGLFGRVSSKGVPFDRAVHDLWEQSKEQGLNIDDTEIREALIDVATEGRGSWYENHFKETQEQDYEAYLQGEAEIDALTHTDEELEAGKAEYDAWWDSLTDEERELESLSYEEFEGNTDTGTENQSNPQNEVAQEPGKPKSSIDKAIDYLDGLLDETKDVAGINVAAYRAALQGIKAALQAGKSIDRAIREAIRYLTEQGETEEAAKEAIEPHRRALQKALGVEKETKAKAVQTRAATGTADEQAKTAVSRHGLDYEVESFDEAEEAANDFIEEVGIDVALEAARRGQVAGAASAAIYIKAIDAFTPKLEAASSQEEVAELYNQQADLIKELDEKARDKGRFNSFLQRGYEKSIYGYSFEKQVEQYKAKGDGTIDPETEAKFKEWDEERKNLLTKIKKLESQKEERDEKRAEQNIKEDAERKTPLTNEQRAKRVANTVRKLKLSRADVFNSSSPAALVWDGAVEAAAVAIETSGKVADGVVAAVRHVTNSEWYKSLSEDRQKEAEKSIRQAIKKETSRQITIDEEGGIKIPGAFLTDAYKAGATTIDALVEAVQAELDNPEITPRQIRDAITKYGQKLNPTKDEIQDEIQRQKNIGKLVSQIEDAQSGLAKATTDKAKKVQSDREIELRKQLKALTKDATNLKGAKTRAQTRIDELEQRLKDGDFSKKKPEPIAADGELADLQAKVTELQDRFDRAQYENEIRTRGVWARLGDAIIGSANILQALNATAEFSFMLIQGANVTASNLWTPKGRQSLRKAMKQMWSNFASEKKTEEATARIKSQPWYGNAKAAGLSLGEQHGKLTVKEELAVTGWANQLWEIIGDELIRPWQKNPFTTSKALDVWKKANPLLAFERAANGYLNTLRIERYLQGVKLLEAKGKTFKNSPESYKDLASVVNMMTSRPKITSDQRIAKGLAGLFYSPKNAISAMVNSTPIAFAYYGSMRGGQTPAAWNQSDFWKPTVAQKIAATDFMRMTITNGAVLGAWALAGHFQDDDDEKKATVPLDPRSSDFLTARYGNMTVDPWHGMRPWWVFQTRMYLSALRFFAEGETPAYKSSQTGNEYHLGVGPIPTAAELAVKQVTNKFNPATSLIWSSMSTKEGADGERLDEIGQPYSFQEEVIDRVRPMYYGAIADVAKDDPDLVEGFMAATGFVGLGVQVQNQREKSLKQRTRDFSKDPNAIPIDELKSQLETGQLKDLSRKNAQALYKSLTSDHIGKGYGWNEKEAKRVLRTLFKGETGLKLDNGNLINSLPDADKEAIKQAYIGQLKERKEQINVLNQLDVKNFYGTRIDWAKKEKNEHDWTKYIK